MWSIQVDREVGAFARPSTVVMSLRVSVAQIIFSAVDGEPLVLVPGADAAAPMVDPSGMSMPDDIAATDRGAGCVVDGVSALVEAQPPSSIPAAAVRTHARTCFVVVMTGGPFGVV